MSLSQLLKKRVYFLKLDMCFVFRKYPNDNFVSAIKSTGWMILFDDSIHNFTNGLALNVAFSHNIFLGIATTIAVTFYRLRHEIGKLNRN